MTGRPAGVVGRLYEEEKLVSSWCQPVAFGGLIGDDGEPSERSAQVRGCLVAAWRLGVWGDLARRVPSWLSKCSWCGRVCYLQLALGLNEVGETSGPSRLQVLPL